MKRQPGEIEMIQKKDKLNRQFLILWTGQLLSKTGSGISAFAIGIYILNKTGSTTAFSMLLLAAFLPSVLLNPVGGIIADRKDRRFLIALGDSGSASGVLIIALSLFLDGNYILLFTGVSVISVFTALHSPAYKASVTDMLDESLYSKAAGMMQLAEASRYIISPAIAALLSGRISLTAILGIDLVSFIIAALTALLSRNTEVKRNTSFYAIEETSFKDDFISGVLFIRSEKELLTLLSVITFITFLTGVLQVLFAPILISASDSKTLGIVQSLSASGMIIGSTFISLFGKKRDHIKSLKLSIAAAGLFFFMTGFCKNVPGITLSAFCLYITLPSINTDIDVLFRMKINNKFQGRVWALISFITQTGMILSFTVTGFLAENFFNPLLDQNGFIAVTAGKLAGNSPEAGSKLMVMMSGILFLITGCFDLKKEKNHKNLFLTESVNNPFI